MSETNSQQARHPLDVVGDNLEVAPLASLLLKLIQSMDNALEKVDEFEFSVSNALTGQKLDEDLTSLNTILNLVDEALERVQRTLQLVQKKGYGTRWVDNQFQQMVVQREKLAQLLDRYTSLGSQVNEADPNEHELGQLNKQLYDTINRLQERFNKIPAPNPTFESEQDTPKNSVPANFVEHFNINSNLPIEERKEREQIFLSLEPDLHNAVDCMLVSIVVDLRLDKSKHQPTKLERMIAVIRAKRKKFGPDALIGFSDFETIFEDTANPHQAIRNWIAILNRKIEAHGWRVQHVTSYQLNPLTPNS